jgi:NADH-quinone oxidoreductase subunit I
MNQDLTEPRRNSEHLKPDWNVGIYNNEPLGWILFLAGTALLLMSLILSGYRTAESGAPHLLVQLAPWCGVLLIIAGAILSDQVNRMLPFHGMRSGMWVTTLNLLRNLDPRDREKFCYQYPDDPNVNRPFWFGPKGAERRNTYLDDPRTRFRGHHVQMRNPQTGELFCISCSQCVSICPNDIITLESEMVEIEVDGKTKKKRKLTKFEVDLSKCFFCGLCHDVCPEPALRLSGGYEYGRYQRARLVANLDNMIRDMTREEYQEYEAQKAEEKRQKELAKKKKAEEAARRKAEVEKAAEAEPRLGEPPQREGGTDAPPEGAA